MFTGEPHRCMNIAALARAIFDDVAEADSSHGFCRLAGVFRDGWSLVACRICRAEATDVDILAVLSEYRGQQLDQQVTQQIAVRVRQEKTMSAPVGGKWTTLGGPDSLTNCYHAAGERPAATASRRQRLARSHPEPAHAAANNTLMAQAARLHFDSRLRCRGVEILRHLCSGGLSRRLPARRAIAQNLPRRRARAASS